MNDREPNGERVGVKGFAPIVRCPTCGADVEFRFDDSFVRVCSHCRAAVVRTDRGVETLGQFADLMPIDSPLKLFAEGRYGTTGFQLIGMAQLRHEAGGVWQEWYARLDGGHWAWISEAQGRIYLTFERSDVEAPSLASLGPGTRITLAGGAYTVAERGTATYISALGEIPYRLVPGSSFQFVDLSDGRGGFATIDFGDGAALPSVYLGAQVTPQGLGLSGGEDAPRVVATAPQGARLACPSCNGSLELRAPDQSLRVGCPYCGALVSVESGALSIIARQDKKPKPAIALGSRGKFVDEPGKPPVDFTVIGYLRRAAEVEGTWWSFDEYLLHAPSVGFRWLACSDGHWSYVQPIAVGAVKLSPLPTYDGVEFRRFQAAPLRVEAVLGEFYWRVQVGEIVEGQDFIAPPAMLSREWSDNEQTWSLSTYLTHAEVDAAFGKKLAHPSAVGVAPNQPYPAGIGKVSALVFTVFCAVAIGKCASAPEAQRLSKTFTFPAAPASTNPRAIGAGSAAPEEPSGTVLFSEPFHLDGGRNIDIELSADVQNNWAYAALDLVNDATGAVVSFDANIEYYSGYDDGAWSEGSQSTSQIIGPVTPGLYVLRVEAVHGGTGDVGLSVRVREGVFRWTWFWVGFAILCVPFGFAWLHGYSFNKKRWENSDLTRFSLRGPR